MSEGGDNPLAATFEAALGRLGAAVLAADEERVQLGYQELELGFAWGELEALLRGADPAAWADAIAETIVETAAGERAAEDDWETARNLVVPLILGERSAADLVAREPTAVAWPYAEVLYLTLVLPLERGWRYITEARRAAWGVAGQELLTIALGNLRRQSNPAALRSIAPAHYALDSADSLDAARLLILDELLPAVAATGVIACVPTRDVLSFAPFTAAGCHHLKALINIARRCHATWPHPISAGLFYVAPGLTLPIGLREGADGAPHLTMPAALAEIQARLVATGKW